MNSVLDRPALLLGTLSLSMKTMGHTGVPFDTHRGHRGRQGILLGNRIDRAVSSLCKRLLSGESIRWKTSIEVSTTVTTGSESLINGGGVSDFMTMKQEFYPYTFIERHFTQTGGASSGSTGQRIAIATTSSDFLKPGYPEDGFLLGVGIYQGLEVRESWTRVFQGGFFEIIGYFLQTAEKTPVVFENAVDPNYPLEERGLKLPFLGTGIKTRISHDVDEEGQLGLGLEIGGGFFVDPERHFYLLRPREGRLKGRDYLAWNDLIGRFPWQHFPLDPALTNEGPLD